MMKAHSHTLGLLNAQYRSVLKKCLLLNLAAAFFMAAAPAVADDWTPNQTANASNSGNLDSKGQTTIGYLKDYMGTTISTDTGANKQSIGTLYIDRNYTQELFSEGSDPAQFKAGAWIFDNGNVYTGYKYDFGTGQITEVTGGVIISNKHNTRALMNQVGGGVFAVGDEDEIGTQPLIKITNTTFENNSASANNPTGMITSGAIANYSNNQDNVISNSKFVKNYVMGEKTISGGAVSNFALDNTDKGYLLSKNNQYVGNYAANETSSTNAFLTQFVGKTTEKAMGGAVYNSSTFISENDVFKSNFAKGTTAQGGAVYNGIENGVTGNFTITNNGSTNFSGNYVAGDELGEGGAVYNNGVISVSGSVFANNYSKATSTAKGGAVSNSGTYTADENNFSNNYAEAATAYGGAVYNAQGGSYTLTGNTLFSGNSLQGVGTTTNTGVFGGAFYNDGTLTATDGGLVFDGNHVNGSVVVKGGALGNGLTGVASVSGATFSNNYAVNDTNNVYGGAVYNEGKITISGATFENNSARAESQTGVSYGGAFANATAAGENTSPLSEIIDSSFKNNQVISASANPGVGAEGGAIYNRAQGENNSGHVSRLQLIARNADIELSGNKALSASGSGIGGAITNDNLGQLDIFAENGHTILFKQNEADLGGALANSASGNGTNNPDGEISRLTVNATGGNIAFSGNKANKYGGVMYNYADEDGMTFKVSDGYELTFSDNTAGVNGGAWANAGNLDQTTGTYELGNIELAVGNNGTVQFARNAAGENGGAIYNLGKITLQTNNVTNTASINFSANKAAKGGAVYNSGHAVFNAGLKKDTYLTFDGNSATSGLGGAIYNETAGDMNFTLSDTAKLVFNTTADDVYNLGTINITGDSPNLILGTMSVGSAVLPQAVNSSQSQIILNSTFAGTGVYNIANTQLNIGKTGYIDYEPTLNLKNTVVNLNSGSYLNLDDGDSLTNNNFDIVSGSIINYKANDGTASKNLANTLKNAGLLNLGDGVLTDFSINTVQSENGTIRIDVDNPNLKADRIIVNDKIFGTTNIAFDNATNLKLGIDDRIYFAQTQAEQSLADYTFVSKASSNIYEIGIGHDENGMVNDWYFYRTKFLSPEVIAYIDLPRSAIEQSRSLLFNVGRLDKGSCNCYRDECNYKVCNFRDMGGKDSVWATPVYRSGTFDKPVETDVKMYGVDFGYDHQFNISSQFGIFGSYRDGTYENSGKGEGDILSNYGSELDITSVLGGAYYRQYFGDLFMSGAVYGGMQSADIKADNGVSASTDGLNLGAQAEIGYDIKTSQRSVLTPSIKATYDYIKFDDIKDSTGKEVSFDTIHDIELEAGIKYEYQFNNERQLPTTGYIKPSVIQTIANGGNVKVNDTTFDKTIENETLGRIEVGADAEIVKNFSLGAFGNYTFGSSYSAWGVGGNIRYKW